MKKAGMVLFVLLILPAVNVQADDFARLRKDSVRISTISANFVQKKFMKILSKLLVSEGKFYFFLE